MKPCIIVHGGASNIADIFVTRYTNGTQDAAKTGYNVLKEGGSALDAVCAAVTSLENNPVFNAGLGSCLTEEGTVEMDAFVMDGKTMRIGAVGAVTGIKNPVQLSRKILEETPHCLLVGEGALRFARKTGHPILDDPKELIVQEGLLKAVLSKNGTYEHNVHTHFHDIMESKDLCETEEFDAGKGSVSHDTVGAVAIDTQGNLAAATSTGGIPGKWIGRVGDAPIPGSGGYANSVGGASSTGHGESIMKSNVCRQVVHNLENGDDPQTAADKAIKLLEIETGSRGGVICINNQGQIGHAFSTHRMGWALINEDGIQYGVSHKE